MSLEASIEFGQVNEPITLYQGVIEVPALEGEYEGLVQVEWQPRYGVVAVIESPSEVDFETFERLYDLVGRRGSIRIQGRGELNVIFTSSSPLTAIVDGRASLGMERSLERLRFGVLNFPDIPLPEPLEYEGGVVAGVVHFEGGGWKVRLEVRASERRALSRRLREEGGYAVTHVGELWRTDGTTFDAAEGEAALQAITTSLSFIRGAWSPTILPIGLDGAGEVIWSSWNRPRADPWNAPHTWSDDVDGRGIAKVCSAMLKQSEDPCWQEVLRRVVSYYLEANRSGESPPFLESRIVNAQAGLELLAWALLDDGCRQAVGEEREGGSGFEKRLREMLRRSHIPADIPRHLKALETWKQQEQWKASEGPVSQARIRVVHPRRRDGSFGIPREAFVEVWLLAVWYLELLILRRLNYNGQYVSRIDYLSPERPAVPVPWAARGMRGARQRLDRRDCRRGGAGSEVSSGNAIEHPAGRERRP